MSPLRISEDVARLAWPLLEAIDASGLGMTITRDRNGTFERLYVNQTMARLLGYSTDEILGRPVLAFVAPYELDRIGALLVTWLRGGSVSANHRLDLLARDGNPVPVELSLASTELTRGDGDERISVMFLRDLRARNRMAEELRNSEKRFRMLVERAPDSVVVLVRGIVRYANPATLAMLRLGSLDEMVGRPVTDFMVADEVPMMVERFERLAQGENTGPKLYTGVRADGSIFALEISSSLSFEWEGEAAILGFGRDVTDRQRMQNELIEADRMASVGLLAAGIAHEINNPLTYTRLHLAKLRRSLADLIPAGRRDEVDRMLGQAIEGCDRVSAIVRGLLAFVRDDQGSSRGPVHLAGVLDSSVELARTAINPRTVIERRYEGDVPPVKGSEARLGQVFLNLIVNAMQAMATMDEVPHLELVIAREGQRNRVDINDRGCGIPPDIAPRIFEPFFTTKDVGQGTGLGLSISRSIVNDLGGTIAAKARAGGGTTFSVWLPVSAELELEQRPEVVPARRDERPARARVLLVDDDPMVLEAMADFLSERYDVECEDSAVNAVDVLLADDDFDAVLCDLSMPDLDGAGVYQRVQAHRPELAGRFLFLTGGARTPRDREFASQHRGRLLDKPLDIDTLFDRIDALGERPLARRGRPAR